MTKQDYLAQLDFKLRVLPESERQDALEYYDGYISDANGEENAIARLGPPGEVAATILADYVARTPAAPADRPYRPPQGMHPGGGFAAPPPRRGGIRTAWFVILAFFAVPVGLPLLIAVGATAFGLFIGLIAVVFSFFVGGGASILAGVLWVLVAPFTFGHDMSFGLMGTGMGLMSIGAGILLISAARWCMRGFALITHFVSQKIINRRRFHHER